MRSEIAKFISREKLLADTDKVLVALSGGADSVALLCVLQELGYDCQAAHCNFHLRAEESNTDEEFVRKWCRERGVRLHVTHFDTENYAAERHISIEMAARELRYAWFEEVRTQTGTDCVAVAHHRDDSVETLLLNLIRGTGINGLKGIRPRNGTVVRPLLAVGRKEIIDYLERRKQPYVTDSTNLHDEYTRNKIRLNILPLMETINPSVRESMASTASRLSETASIYNKVIEEGKQRVAFGNRIHIASLRQEPAPRALLFELLYPLGYHSAQVEDIYSSLTGQPGRCFCSKEWMVLKDREYLLIRSSAESTDGVLVMELPETGEVVYANPSRRIKVERKLFTPDSVIPRQKHTASFDWAKLSFPLTLRKWQKGDRFVPFGMKGTKKISDYLTNCKFSLYEKEQMYVVCAADRVAWLVGERSDNRFRVDENTREVLILTALP